MADSLPARVNTDLATALRSRDQETLDTLRMLKTALTNKRVELTRDLDDREALQVVTTLVKQRKDSASQFSAAGRDELADKNDAKPSSWSATSPQRSTPMRSAL